MKPKTKYTKQLKNNPTTDFHTITCQPCLRIPKRQTMLANDDEIKTHAAVPKRKPAGESELCHELTMTRPMPIMTAATKGAITAYQAVMLKNDRFAMVAGLMLPK